MSILTDTAPEAERVLCEALRRMPFERRWRQMGAMYQTARALHTAGVKARNSRATVEDIRRDWMINTLGADLAENLEPRPMLTSDDNLSVLREVIETLSRLDIAYALGGSWASSLLGKMRFTQDADLTVEPFPGKEAALVRSFGEDYYLSLPAVQQAVLQRSSFNIIHTPSGFKVDLFVRKDRLFDQAFMQRRQLHTLPGEPQLPIQVVTAEDIVLLKLEWYRQGRETSERQWSDILGVLQVQAGKLDQKYLDTWSATLGIADLLARARQEASNPPGSADGSDVRS